MTGADVLDVARDSIFVLLQVSLPLMLIGFVIGLIIALVRALTQIQEATLTFVPKLRAIFVALLVFLPFMGQALHDLMLRLSARIIGL